MLKLSTATLGLTVISKSRLGDISEQWVKLLAHWKGCEVFQNVGCTGKTDIVFIHPTLGPLQIDVKTTQWKDDITGGRWKSDRASDVKRPVYAVCVDPDGDIANWKIHWRNLNKSGWQSRKGQAPLWDCPPGWENFWDNDHRIYSTNSTKPTNEPTPTD